ncbi:MAG: DHH family phosphoesterase [Pseudomonadota bacterium]
MAAYDVFNGDADGICALVQLRLAEPRAATLITGVKRDVALLKRIEPRAGDRITVLDISMRNNRGALDAALEAGAHVLYVDHHNPGDVPAHERLQALIDTDAESCTSLIVDRHLQGAHHDWAIVAAYGDGLGTAADRLASAAGFDDTARAHLSELGTLINYNGYGATLADLHFRPDDLYRRLVRHRTPAAFIVDDQTTLWALRDGHAADMAVTDDARTVDDSAAGLIVMLPDGPAARRASGTYGNRLALSDRNRAHAVLTEKAKGGYLVSVRAPLARCEGADHLCLEFDTGGGRTGAAGINHLPADQLDTFVTAFREAFKP